MKDSALAPAAAAISIVAAEHVALRYLFVSPATWNGSSARRSGVSMGLDRIHARLAASPDAAMYVDPITSFYADVTIPFTTRRQLPVVALTERLPRDGAPAQRWVEIEIQAIEMEWEGRTVHVPPARIPALFTDCLTFFDSGHVVYAPAFLLQYSQARVTAQALGASDASALHATALTSLVGTPGLSRRRGLDGIRSKILFKVAGEDGRGQDLLHFINRRLSSLCNERDGASVFADLIEPAVMTGRSGNKARAKVDPRIAKMAWSDLRSASLEIVGAARHDEIVGWCRAARDGTVRVGHGERALAALGQNVLDVDNQDEHEIADSLSQASVSDEHVLLINPKLAVLYSRQSRSFAQMCRAIGGCPYVMLTNVVLAYNEYMLDQSAELIETIMRTGRNSRWGLSGSKTKTLRADLETREKLFENQTLNLLPNIFRYPGEREMFESVEKQRGLQQRAAGFERFARNLYELRQSDAELDEREGTRRINLWLLALGILQGAGLFLAALGLEDFKGTEAIRDGLWAGFALFSVAALVAAGMALSRR
jgi:hypothetical protein